ncbi:ABC transporter substrate-binding protein [soil metagenome]
MMHEARKSRTTALAVALSAGVTLAACGGNDGGASADGAVEDFTVMSRWSTGTPEYEALQAQVASFTEETGVDVEIIDGGEDIDITFETAVAAGQSPDVIAVNLFDKSLSWLDAGVTVPADEYLTEWGLEDKISEEALLQWRQGQTEDGALLGMPYSGFAWPIWFNTTLLADAGVDEVPTSTDDLLSTIDALDDAGTPPMIVGGADWSGQKLFFQTIQTYLSAEQAQTLFSDGGYCENAEAMQGIDLFIELRDRGLFVDNVAGLTADDMNNTYFSEGAAMMPAGSWAFAPAAAADEESGNSVVEATTLGGMPVPEDAALEDPSIYLGFTGVGFMLTPTGAEDDRVDASRAFIEGFYTEETAADFVAKANLVSAVEGDFSEASSNPLLTEALELDSASNAVLPDVWIGSASEALTQVSTLAYGSADGQAICEGLDSASN